MGMRRGVLTLCGLLIAISAASPAWAKGWLRDVDHALSVARAQQRPIVLFVSMDGCVHCDKMIATTFRDIGVRQALGASFVAAAIKGSERPDLMEHLSIRSFPTTLLVSPEGEVLDQMVGYVDAEKFQSRLTQVASRRQNPPASVAQTERDSARFASRPTAQTR